MGGGCGPSNDLDGLRDSNLGGDEATGAGSGPLSERRLDIDIGLDARGVGYGDISWAVPV